MILLEHMRQMCFLRQTPPIRRKDNASRRRFGYGRVLIGRLGVVRRLLLAGCDAFA